MIRFALLVCGFVAVASLSAVAQEDGQIYRIKNKLTEKELAPDESGKLLVQHKEKPNDTSHHWKLQKNENGYFQIVNVGSGKVLTAPSKDALAQIALEENAGNRPKLGQVWAFELREKRYWIQSRHSDFYLDVFNFETENGTKIIQQELNPKGGRGNQLWELIPVK